MAVVAYLEAAAFLGLLVPGETGILVGGIVAGQGHIDIVGLIALAWAAAFLGDLTGYVLGRRLGRPFLVRHGPRFGLGPDRLRTANVFFDRHGGKAIFVGRFIGLVRSLGPFLAGSSRMPLGALRPVRHPRLGHPDDGPVPARVLLLALVRPPARPRKAGALALGLTLATLAALAFAVHWMRNPENRKRVDRWLQKHGDRWWVAVVNVTRRRGARPARFLCQRLTPGDLGLELTTLLAVSSVAAHVFLGYLIVIDDGLPTVATGARRAWQPTRRPSPPMPSRTSPSEAGRSRSLLPSSASPRSCSSPTARCSPAWRWSWQAAAGPVNSVVNRMLDILPTVIRVAEVLHDTDLSERESQLMLRLQIGLPADLVPIAMRLGTDASRPQYLALHRAGLTTSAAIRGAEPDRLLDLLDGDQELRQGVLDAAAQLDDLEKAA